MIQEYNYSKLIGSWIAQADREKQTSGDIEAEKRVSKLERFLSIYGNIGSVSSCFYCSGSTLLWKTHEDPEHREPDSYNEAINAIKLAICRSCGWYRYTIEDFQDAYIIVSHHVATLSGEKRNIDDTPLHELKRYLSKNWSERKLISAGRAEELVADIFREHLDCEIEYTTNGVYHSDGGIDFVLVNTATGIRYAFQVKRRLTDSPERVQPVREFIDSVAQSHFNHGFFVTTADRFTQYTKDELSAKRPLLELRDIKLTLVDGGRLLDLMKQQAVTPETAQIIQDYFPSV
jgi:restriction endonuclease